MNPVSAIADGKWLRLGAVLFVALPLFAASVSAAPNDESTGKKGIDSVSYEEIKAKARDIDSILQKAWQANGVSSNGRIGHDTFLRRTYLKLGGRIPSVEETIEFLKRPNRAGLIDSLLESDAFVSAQFNFWADLLRIRNDQEGLGLPYIEFVKDSIRKNKPYNQFVKEMLLASGYTWENGAAGYYMRDYQMPLDNMSNTMQVFLGTRMQCAQCHDHPFDKWTQMDYYQLAAYTYGVETRLDANQQPKGFADAYKQSEGNRELRDQIRDSFGDMDRGVAVNNTDIKLPFDYKYDDGKPHQAVKPRVIYGEDIVLEKDTGENRVKALANWVTSDKNERFALVYANRLWKQAFGMGLIEPVDDMTDETQAVIPELMTYLSKMMVELKYDTRQFLRVLYNTSAYQSQVNRKDIEPGEPYYFTGPVLKRMNAEQFWDSLVTLTIPEPDARKAWFGGEQARVNAFRQYKNKSAGEIIAAAKKGQGMMMMGGNGGNDPQGNDPRWRGYGEHLRRASELQSPANLGSFLRQFGQSDRDVIDNSVDDPNVSQVLEMFNGRMFEEVTSPDSLLSKNMSKYSRDRVKVLFLSILNREPSSEELRFTAKILAGRSEKSGYSAVIWALLNTRQFSFVE